MTRRRKLVYGNIIEESDGSWWLVLDAGVRPDDDDDDSDDWWQLPITDSESEEMRAYEDIVWGHATGKVIA